MIKKDLFFRSLYAHSLLTYAFASSLLMLILMCVFCNMYYAIIHIPFSVYLCDAFIVFSSSMTAKNVNVFLGISYSFVVVNVFIYVCLLFLWYAYDRKKNDNNIKEKYVIVQT